MPIFMYSYLLWSPPCHLPVSPPLCKPLPVSMPTPLPCPPLPVKVEEYADEVFDLLNNGGHIFFCGLKGMMPGIVEMLEQVCKSKGLSYEEWSEKLKHKNQWHVEVY